MVSELRSHRLILRALQLEDAVRIAALLHDDRDAIRRMSHMPDPCTVEAAREWIAVRTAPEAATFAIMRAGDGVFLGVIGFGGLPEMPGVGYWIGRPYWGQGYATESLRLMVGYARSRGAHGLQAETFPDNPASARVLAKCGFQDRGLGLRDYPARGGLVRVRIHILHFATHDARADSGCDGGSSSSAPSGATIGSAVDAQAPKSPSGGRPSQAGPPLKPYKDMACGGLPVVAW